MTLHDEAFAKRQEFLQALAVLINYAGKRISDDGEFNMLAMAVLEAADVNRDELDVATADLEAKAMPRQDKH